MCAPYTRKVLHFKFDRALELKFVAYGKDEIMARKVFDSAARRVTNVIPQFNISLGPEKHLR
jgi:hypothetical protein